MKPGSNAEPKRFALGASPDCRRVTVDGVSIAYNDCGQGFPVVGLHAITHGSRDFEHVADRMARKWRLITPDWPGQGRSDVDTHPARLARYTDLLAGFMDALNLERAILIGNSIGGSAAIKCGRSRNASCMLPSCTPPPSAPIAAINLTSSMLHSLHNIRR